MSALASSRLAPSFTVTSLSRGVMMFFTGWSRFVSKRRSRLVTMPTTRPPSRTGRPEMRCWRVISSTSPHASSSGETVIGSFTTPLSKRLTFATSSAWASGVMFLWTMPMPPSWASAMASRDSVTVSMAAESSGRFSWIDRVRLGGEADFAGKDGRMGGNEEDVVKCERFLDDAHAFGLDTKGNYTGAPAVPTIAAPCRRRSIDVVVVSR